VSFAQHPVGRVVPRQGKIGRLDHGRTRAGGTLGDRLPGRLSGRQRQRDAVTQQAHHDGGPVPGGQRLGRLGDAARDLAQQSCLLQGRAAHRLVPSKVSPRRAQGVRDEDPFQRLVRHGAWIYRPAPGVKSRDDPRRRSRRRTVPITILLH